MNELITDLKKLNEDTLNNLRSSKATNTLRAYKSDFKDFEFFCSKHSFNSLPTEPKVVSLYLTHLSTSCKMSARGRGEAFGSVGFSPSSQFCTVKYSILGSEAWVPQ